MARVEKIVNCPLCKSEAAVVESVNEKGKYHVCCSRKATMKTKSCDLYIGYEKDGKILWFDSRKKAIDYWNQKAKN